MAKTNETLDLYSAEEIIKSKTYKRYVDLLCCHLEDAKHYSKDEVNAILDKALNRVVED